MQGYLFYKGTTTTTTYTDWSGSSSWNNYYPTAKKFSFGVDGFGINPGRKLIDPTPGSYNIDNSDYGHGVVTEGTRYTGSGALYYSRRYDGYVPEAAIIPALYPVFDDTVYNNALSDFWEGVKQTESNLALTIGEARETGRMLKVGKSIFEVLKLARSARKQALTNPSKSLADIWLGMKYGWMPLYSDIYGYLHWIYTRFNEGVPVRGRSSRKSDKTTFIPHQFGTREVRKREEWKAEVKCWLRVNNDSNTYDISRITSLNPVSIAWELVTLSFVVDWFYNVGGYLQNMESALASGCTFERGYVSQVALIDAYEDVISDYVYPYGGYTDFRTGVIKAKVYRVSKSRVKLTGFPFPRAPTLELRLGWQRLFSAAALLRTILLGGVKGKHV